MVASGANPHRKTFNPLPEMVSPVTHLDTHSPRETETPHEHDDHHQRSRDERND
jgi:hypothetical protein